MQGRRVELPNLDRFGDLEPGDYALVPHDGILLPFHSEDERGVHNDLWFRDPTGSLGRCCAHALTVHDDATITASPSISVCHSGMQTWHGFLERGQWLAC